MWQGFWLSVCFNYRGIPYAINAGCRYKTAKQVLKEKYQ
jgi:hypothetical protein